MPLFRKDYKIKISENTHSIGSETETIKLLDLKDLEQIQREKFKILHIGAIQVAAKPLTRLGLDKPICICLRDARHNQFQDSLLGLMQTNTSLAPVYFTCYPNLECDAPKPGGPLTTRQPAEYKWMSGYPTPLQKIG